jgi:hypothetical protein
MRYLKNLILIGAVGSLSAAFVHAQAPPGPLPPPAPSASSSVPPPRPVTKREPRKTIFGDWKLNHDDSDDPRSKMHKATASNPNNGGMNGPRMGWPGGMGGYGGPRPTRNPQADTNETNEKLQALIDPSVRLNLYQKEPKDPHVELTGDQGKKMIFYTDGQKPDKPSDPNELLVSARWDGAKLVSDEDLAKNGKLSRTFELSEDGTQLYEEVHLDTGKKKDAPVTIRYVYDAVSPDRAS